MHRDGGDLCQRCLQDQQINPRGWKHHWPESGCAGVSEEQRFTDIAALNHAQSIIPASFHPADPADLILPQTF